MAFFSAPASMMDLAANACRCLDLWWPGNTTRCGNFSAPLRGCPKHSCSGLRPWCMANAACKFDGLQRDSEQGWIYCDPTASLQLSRGRGRPHSALFWSSASAPHALEDTMIPEHGKGRVENSTRPSGAGGAVVLRNIGAHRPSAYAGRALFGLADTACALGYGCNRTEGCMVVRALNYDSTATLPGACAILGCTNPLSPTYDPQATLGDGCYGGCTARGALNYDSQASWWDNNCVWPMYGCTDSRALNYQPSANTDDEFNPCVLPSPSPQEGPRDTVRPPDKKRGTFDGNIFVGHIR